MHWGKFFDTSLHGSLKTSVGFSFIKKIFLESNLFKVGFGSWRFFLAFLVAISHLYANMIHGPAAYAVWGFYLLSGYLMTFILTKKYGFSRAGLKGYAFNRFLRIFPSYWLISILGVITIFALKDKVQLTELNPEFALPSDWTGWPFIVTLLPIFPKAGLTVPVSSALAIEVGAYILLPLMAFRRWVAWAFLILALLINAKLGIHLESFAIRYATFWPCLLPFAAGALVCHYQKSLEKFSMPLLSMMAWIAHCGIWLYYPTYPWLYGLYVSILLSAWVVLSLCSAPVGKTDAILGELSYPLYLIHTTAGAWLLPAFGTSRPLPFFLISFAITLGLSWLVVAYFERPLARKKITPRPLKTDLLSPQAGIK